MLFDQLKKDQTAKENKHNRDMEAMRRKQEKDREDAENELRERTSMLMQLAEKARIEHNHELAQQREDAAQKFEEALREGKPT